MKECVIASCGKKVVARGLCNAHYKKAKADGSLAHYTGMPKICLERECENKVRARGRCDRHYTIWYESERRIVSNERKEKQKAYYDRLSSRDWSEVEIPDEKKCPNCGMVKKGTEFYRSIRSKGGLMSQCKSCEDDRVKTYWASNGGRRHVSLNYLARKKSAAGYLPANAKDILSEFYGPMCAKCGAVDNLQIDHVISLRSGGPNTLANAQLLCQSDNAAKGKRNLDYRDLSNGLLVDFIDGKFIVEVDFNGNIAS